MKYFYQHKNNKNWLVAWFIVMHTFFIRAIDATTESEALQHASEFVKCLDFSIKFIEDAKRYCLLAGAFKLYKKNSCSLNNESSIIKDIFKGIQSEPTLIDEFHSRLNEIYVWAFEDAFLEFHEMLDVINGMDKLRRKLGQLLEGFFALYEKIKMNSGFIKEIETKMHSRRKIIHNHLFHLLYQCGTTKRYNKVSLAIRSLDGTLLKLERAPSPVYWIIKELLFKKACRCAVTKYMQLGKEYNDFVSHYKDCMNLKKIVPLSYNEYISDARERISSLRAHYLCCTMALNNLVCKKFGLNQIFVLNDVDSNKLFLKFSVLESCLGKFFLAMSELINKFNKQLEFCEVYDATFFTVIKEEIIKREYNS